ncbi:Anti-FecI sigma factor, FecR OS=Chthoniobacter flavus Ellin428 GN=CfE428DRAFT_4845 PE=4 SV=1: FecR [Gemmataceae bacterium]|nr:Anti-FecI sigma factor, FecR OS=Chthoniobacter flavus Ellin428 GN=CfE428DRAFT_4845 PE=4 SV=1: FecR [Gemmataceae bacterium]VTU01803.1 Anti-FecI sigma factor, FecR OS=Chthoniobacter flavus Ellin428 GN=CfE428DRAFT_4845 PE=4 SV=1: FecR [Gemmataceae bacterium]
MPVAEVTHVTGECWQATADERRCESGAAVRSGDTVRTSGAAATATVRFPDGTEVVLAGDTAVSVADAGAKSLHIHRGDLALQVVPQPPGRPLRVETADAVIEVAETNLSVSCLGAGTAVDVRGGKDVSVRDRARDEAVAVRAGEAATVSPTAPLAPKPRPGSLASWAVDFREGVPRGWQYGAPTTVGGRAALRAEPVWVKQHGREHYQVASPNTWGRGLFTFDATGNLSVDLLLERPGAVQAILVVRDDPAGVGPPPQVYIHDDIAAGVPAGGWQTVRAPLKDFRKRFDLAPHRAPTAFLVILDTHDQDLGMVVGRIQAGAD